MRTASTIKKLIKLYRAEIKRIEQEPSLGDNTTVWIACKVAIADLYEELEASDEPKALLKLVA